MDLRQGTKSVVCQSCRVMVHSCELELRMLGFLFGLAEQAVCTYRLTAQVASASILVAKLAKIKALPEPLSDCSDAAADSTASIRCVVRTRSSIECVSHEIIPRLEPQRKSNSLFSNSKSE